MTCRIVWVASLLSLSAFAYDANLNIDWKFKKIGSDLYGLDAALKAADVELRVFYGPPSETNFAGGLLTGEQAACRAACEAPTQPHTRKTSK